MFMLIPVIELLCADSALFWIALMQVKVEMFIANNNTSD